MSTELRPDRLCDATPKAGRAGEQFLVEKLDSVERPLFGLHDTPNAIVVVEAKVETIKRVFAPACPECDRRGYHVSVCARRSLLEAGAARAGGRAFTEFEVRWIYFVLVKHFSKGSLDVRVSDIRRGAPTKIGGVRLKPR